MNSDSTLKHSDGRTAVRLAKRLWPGQISTLLARQLSDLADKLRVSILLGDVQLFDGKWYVTHPGLIRLARRSRYIGIHVEPAPSLSDRSAGRWAFKANVYKSRTCKGFVGYGDADPSNVCPLVRGDALRVAETRASIALRGRTPISAQPWKPDLSQRTESLFFVLRAEGV
jgi:hypothetical protein